MLYLEAKFVLSLTRNAILYIFVTVKQHTGGFFLPLPFPNWTGHSLSDVAICKNEKHVFDRQFLKKLNGPMAGLSVGSSGRQKR